LVAIFNPLRGAGEKAREPGVPEPEVDRQRILVQAEQAARAFANGADGTRLAPPEIQSEVARWRERLEISGQSLDHERWLIGLLTLSCLSRRDAQAAQAQTSK
jgi:alkanesulfonate monooxygenase SsuD/methylene tetrahydromethanopterin reductase-like flavin-dependent oxidoreductase (luciferase family)